MKKSRKLNISTRLLICFVKLCICNNKGCFSSSLTRNMNDCQRTPDKLVGVDLWSPNTCFKWADCQHLTRSAVAFPNQVMKACRDGDFTTSNRSLCCAKLLVKSFSKCQSGFALICSCCLGQLYRQCTMLHYC